MSSVVEYANVLLAWCLAHPEVSVPALVYLVYNIIPRTPPQNRFLFALWAAVERIMFLSWDRFGGTVKTIGFISPDPSSWEDVDKK